MMRCSWLRRSFRELEKQARRDRTEKTGASTMPSKRELIEPHNGDKRFVRRDNKGEFSKEVDVGESLAADGRQHSETVAKAGQGDKGDRKTKR
jgi:hypothetical protein